jgi:hypothetical protein
VVAGGLFRRRDLFDRRSFNVALFAFFAEQKKAQEIRIEQEPSRMEDTMCWEIDYKQ